jgi:signal transduction histidine kinase
VGTVAILGTRDKDKAFRRKRQKNSVLKHAMEVCLVTTDSRSSAPCHQAASEPSLNFYELAPISSKHDGLGLDELRSRELESAASKLPDPPASAKKTASGRLLAANGHRVGRFLKKLPAGPESGIIPPSSRSTFRTLRRNSSVRDGRKRSENISSIGDHRSRGSRQNSSAGNAYVADAKVRTPERDRSVARVVHDLRTPLMASSGYCDLLLAGAMGALRDEQADLVERIRHSLGRLARMTEAMLQRSGDGRDLEARVQLQSTPIQACLEHALNETGPLARKKKLTVTVEVAQAGTNIPIDPEQIERVFINLLENSCKFTPNGGKIRIRAYPVARHKRGRNPEEPKRAAGPAGARSAPWGLRVDVIDTGVGISTENLERVFEEYVSYGGAENSSGRGLGLATCKMIVTAHGGRIWAEKHRGGAKISFFLPASNATQNCQPEVPSRRAKELQSA